MQETDSFPIDPKASEAFERLAKIVEELRQKCPWDKVQTKETLRHLTIEETYELADSILKDDYSEIKKELGDLLLHVLFYSSLATESEEFGLSEMINTQCEKLIRRHPHIYGDATVDGVDDVMMNWEQIKAQERKDNKEEELTLNGVPTHLPSIIKAFRMQEKAAKVGFDWDNGDQVWDKVKEEILEFENTTNADEAEDEMGDIFFSLINYCRFRDINPEAALARTNIKFKKRFDYIERKAQAADRKLIDMELAEMEAWWQEAKGI